VLIFIDKGEEGRAMHDLKLLGSILTVVGVLIAGSAGAALLPAIHIPAIIDASELIVVGRANGTVSTSDSSETFLILADRVLKNAGALPQSALVVRLDIIHPGYRWVAEGQYGIFFLRRLGPNRPYTAVDPYNPVVAASPVADLTAPNSANPLSSVTRELARVLTTPGSTLIDPVTGVRNLAVGAPAEQLHWVYFYVARALASIPYETTGPPLRAMAISGSIPARLWAIDCLLSTGYSEEIESVILNGLKSVEPVLLDPTPDVALTVAMVGNHMLGNITSAKAVPQLAALLESSEPAVRRAAAGNLSVIGTDAVIAPLARLALHDQSSDVRYYAVQGLAIATGLRDRPTRAAYEEAEPDMLAFWREWAKRMVH
jgi:HEAT repeats